MMSRDRRGPEQRFPGSEEATARQGTPGKVTRVEHSGAGAMHRYSHSGADGSAGGATAEAGAGNGQRAGDWHLDEMLLTAMGFGDLGRSETGEDGDAAASPAALAGPGSASRTSSTAASAGDRERHGAALGAAAADRDARERDPVVLYLNIHSNSIAHAVAAMLQAHEEEWPAPSSEISWGDAARFTRKMVRALCPVVRDDSFALFQLVHPLSPDEAYRRYVAGARAARKTWIPGFGEAVAAQVKAAMFSSIERLGARFHAAAVASNGEPPSSSQIQASHPLDTYVRGAMAEQDALDYSLVSRRAPAKSAAEGRGARAEASDAKDANEGNGAHEGSDARRAKPGAGAAKRSALTVQWLGREDASLWNYVRVSPANATAEEVAAALYGSPAQSRMAFALQQHGDLFQVAPKQARELIASRYPGEVTGQGTARDGAALARSPLGDELALRGAGTATSEAQAATLPQLLMLHFSILGELEKLRAAVAPLGLSSKLDPAYAFRARTMLEATNAAETDAAEQRQQQRQRVWHAQHVHLMRIAAAVPPLAAQTTATTVTTPAPPPPARVASLRARLSKYLAAAAISHGEDSCAALLDELEAERRQELIDQATESQIGLREVLRQAQATPGQGRERGSDEADAALTRAQAEVLRGGDAQQLQEAQLGAEEVSLRTRLETVRLALAELSAAADQAGAGLASELASRCSGKFRSLPALLDALQLRLHDVERAWASTERAAPRPDVVADEREAQLVERQARAKGLEAASEAFAKIAGDQDIGTFLRESQEVVSSQQFRSGVVQLAGALVITVVTSGVAAQLGAGLAGLVGAGEAGSVLTAGALAARASGAALNLAVNITVNSALQYAMSEGRDGMGWALVENALMELATRGLGRVLKGPMTELRAIEQKVLRDGQRLRQLNQLERAATRRGATFADELVEERNVLRETRMDRAAWFVVDLTTEMVIGMASQWAARSLLQTLREPRAEVSDDFASNVLQQGAAIMLGKRLFGLKASWNARRAELEAQPWFTQLPEARALIDRRKAFFDDANTLASSLSPELGAGPKLLVHHEELVRLELELVAQGNASDPQTSAAAPRATAEGSVTAEHGAEGQRSASAVSGTAVEKAGVHPRSAKEPVVAPEASPPRAPASDRGGAAKEPIGLFGDDTRALAAARHLRPEPGYIDVFAHATAEKLVVKRLDGDVEVTHRQLAEYLRKHGLEGMKLRLIGCSSGAHSDAVAQRLADAHGMEVLAPSKDIWIGPNGEHGIGKVVGDNTGSWTPFKPRNKETAPVRDQKEPTPLENELRWHEGEFDHDPPESVRAPHVDRRVRMSRASPDELAEVRQELRVPVVIDAAMVDGVRILARRVPRLIGFDLVVQEVHVGGEALTSDVLAHARTIAAVEQYNGIVANLRELRQRLQSSAGRWFGGGQPSGRRTADAALRTARGETKDTRPLEEQPLHFPRGSRGWMTELELRKLHALLEARKTPLHQGAVDVPTLHDEISFLEGRRLLHEEVLRSIDDTTARAPVDGEVSLERPDTGDVTREALSKGYRLPGPEENARPDWYYYRNSLKLPGQYELARKPGMPTDAPGLRARIVGDTFTGFEPLGATGGTEIPHTKPPKEVVDHLRETPGFGKYLEMLQTQGLASRAVVDGVILQKLNLLGMSGKRVTTEELRGDVRDHFRERVTAHLCDPLLSDTASWRRLREMAEQLSPTERGGLAEIWYRHRHTNGAKGQTRVDVTRTSGIDKGQVQRRVVDAVEGDMAIEVKDVAGPIDRDQFGAYLDMLQNPVDGSDPLFRKVKYVFTKLEGAMANLEYMGRVMGDRRFQGKLIVECFDHKGRKHTVASARDAMRFLVEMEMR